MEENALKTSWKQRLIIALVAIILLGSSVAVYVAIVLSGDGGTNYASKSTTELESLYEEAYGEYEARATELSADYFDEFSSYRSSVKAFNAAAANSSGVQSNDLKEGDGATVANGQYSAYYIGYCADETIFDSSFDDFENPTTLRAPLDVQESNLIAGWYTGVDGMKIGGVREITIPGELAYGDTYEICGDYNSPLKFIVYAVENDAKILEITEKLNQIYSALSKAYAASYSDYSDTSDSETLDTVEATEE